MQIIDTTKTRIAMTNSKKESLKKNFRLLITTLLLIAFATSCKEQKDPDTKYYPPKGESKNVAIMMIGGSEGGLPNYFDTEGFTAKGYPCIVIGYFKTKNTPERLELIPLEYFEDAIMKFKSQPDVGNKKILVWGNSKGGELALLLASRYKQIEGVIASVPSSVVFQGIGASSSSWSYKGEPIPFVPYAPYDQSKVVNREYREMYELSLKQTAAVEKAAIKVENINGPILLLSGREDTMWPSSQMSEMIIKRLEEKEFPHWSGHFAYDDAGHTLDDSYMMGGNKVGNKKARIDSEQRIIDFINKLSQQ
ncbi:MAG: hypothetical protein O6940_14290, partial [Ignavibacteria bacterium]|nr:hypothetical protein [Ignavibacteria bacterium]